MNGIAPIARSTAKVDDHATEHDARNAESRRLEDHPTPDERGDRVADDRDQADDRVDTDLGRRAGDGDELVEHVRDSTDAAFCGCEAFGAGAADDLPLDSYHGRRVWTNVHAGSCRMAGGAFQRCSYRVLSTKRTAGHQDHRPAARRSSGGMPGDDGAGNSCRTTVRRTRQLKNN
jgi:hypothetical protein